jgi:hypothetical protein
MNFNGPEAPTPVRRSDSSGAVFDRMSAYAEHEGRVLIALALELARIEREPSIFRAWGYTSLLDCLDREFGITKTKGRRLRRVVRVFRDEGLPDGVMLDLGFIRAEIVSHVFWHCGQGDWVDKARRLPLDQLRCEVERAIGRRLRHP